LAVAFNHAKNQAGEVELFTLDHGAGFVNVFNVANDERCKVAA